MRLRLIGGWIGAVRAVVGAAVLAAVLGTAAMAATEAGVTKLEPFEVVAPAPITLRQAFPMADARYGAAAVSDGVHVYVVGGANAAGTRLDDISRFDPETGRWTQWAKLAVPRRFHRAVMAEGKLFVLGGTAGPAARSRVPEELGDYYDTQELIDAIDGERGRAGALWGGIPAVEIGVSTPFRTMEYLDSVEIFDLADGTRSKGPPMPVAKAWFGCAVLGRELWVVGGQRRRGDTISVSNTAHVLDLATMAWREGVNLPTPRRVTATTVDGILVVIGGFDGRRSVPWVEALDPAASAWRRLPELQVGVNPTAVVFQGRHLFLFGDNVPATRQLAYDLVEKRLVPYAALIPNANFAAAVGHRGRIYVLGGRDPTTDVPHAEVREFVPLASDG